MTTRGSAWVTPALALLLSILPLLHRAIPLHAQTTATESQVKAAYLYNFASFVSWPVTAFEGPTSPFRVCVAGKDPFGAVLEDTLRGESIGGRPMVLVHQPEPAELRRCHILYVAPMAARPGAVATTTAMFPVLTVGDGGGFLRSGGVLEFVSESGRVRFDVNLTAATGAGLTLSSRLLQVARRVQR